MTDVGPGSDGTGANYTAAEETLASEEGIWDLALEENLHLLL